MATENQPAAQSRLYQPLLTDRPEIRILVLEGSSDYDAEIRCRLERYCYFDMERRTRNARSYEALSYTWGDPARSRNIIVNDEIFPVTDHLEAFLRERREDEGNDVDLWVDAICINQEDSLEKNHQIPLMNVVYSFASSLTVWLGPSTADSPLAMEWLSQLGQASPYAKMPILGDEVIEAIQKLLDRPWWTRAWIVQELVAGGLGPKIGRVTVRCGKDSVLWTQMVISAARFKAYQDDMRQVFPNIANILELDSLRDSASLFALDRASLTTPYEMLCRYRHFLATDPRDKIYAICDVFSRYPSQRLKPTYDAPVEAIYTAFARQVILASEDLDFLRYCGARKLGIPSWVPDWSIPLKWQPLPVKVPRRYFDVPWWAEPEVIEDSTPAGSGNNQETALPRYRYTLHPHPDNEDEATLQQQMRIKRLETVAQGFQAVTSMEELARQLPGLNISPDNMEDLQGSLGQNELMFFVKDSAAFPPRTTTGNAVRQGELMTERRMKEWLLKELQEPLSESPYQGAGSTKPDIKMDELEDTMTAGGIEWDTVDMCHDSFVQDVESDWKDTTRFMVAVGCCKALAVAHPAVVSRYPAPDSLLEAFWLTMFAGQVIGDADDAQFRSHFTEWLPDIPKSWTAVDPPVTATTSGQVTLTEVATALKGIYITSTDEENPSSSGSQIRSILDEQEGCQQMTKAVGHKEEFSELAASWSQQPYDLYHRPFEFVNIVPDPYWNTRKREDMVAQRNAKETRVRLISGPLNATDDNSQESEAVDDDASSPALGLSNTISKVLHERVSMVPVGTLGRGFERYALGRKYFITSKGYLGLGPSDTMPGDRVAILFGSHVPFLLRKRHNEPKEPTWEMIGEGYVHGIMKGEVMEQWETGAVESQRFQLQ